MKRLFLGLVLLGAVGAASAELGTYTQSPACCQLTTSLVQDVVYGRDPSSDERLFSDTTPPNLHILIDTSGSMKELPQVFNSRHSEFFDLTVNGCQNPRLDALQASRGWDPAFVYPVPDMGTGWGSDSGFPNLFQDSKFYGYLYWSDYSNPTPQWDSKELACQSQVPGGTTNPAEYTRCLQCLGTKGYYKVPGTLGRDTPPLENLNFIFWGRFLNFNPPKYVTAKAVLKSVIKDVRNMRVGLSYFSNSAPNTVLLRPQNPSCSQIASDPSAFDSNRASYISSINSLAFTTGTPLARSLLNLGYYFSSSDSVYRNDFGFGTSYAYPSSFANGSLLSQSRSVCWGCQGSSVIIIADSEPSGDSLPSTVVTRLRTLNNGPVYCPDSQPCTSGGTSGRDMGINPGSYTDDNPNYLLDDVAKLLSTQDLQRNVPPIVGDFDTSGKQSLRIHTIGLGINSNILRNTAQVGGGLHYTVDDAQSLKQALLEILRVPSSQARTAGLATSSVEGQPVGAQASALVTRIKAPVDPSGPWQGALYRFQLAEERLLGCQSSNPYAGGDLNQDGDCDDTHLIDANGDVVTESASSGFVKALWPMTPAQPFWEAGQVLKPSGSAPSQKWMTRRIFTLVDTNGDNKLDRQDTPVAFTEDNVFLLREYLGISQNPNDCAALALKLGEPGLTPDECARLVIRWYRGADALNPDPALRHYDRPFLLQDILHSTPISVEPPQPKASCALSGQCLPALFRGETQMEYGYGGPSGSYADAYDTYTYEAGDRDKLVLVGSNGGMLHAFLNGRSIGVDSSTGRRLYDAGTGQELWAFVPPDLLPRLRNNLGKHASLVDGTAMVRDVWLDGVAGQPADGRKQWPEYRTVAVVGTGRGGVHRFALDLTRLLGEDPGDTSWRVPDQAGDFLWMWPQPCDPLALKVGESFTNFAPQPPPIGPVALMPEADDALRMISNSYAGWAETPWWINQTPARERWVVALNGGYDPYNNRGRGMALVDLASGHTVWSFFHNDGRGRSEHLRYSISAGLSLADVGTASSYGVEADHLFDTATVGDYGGQLWTVRFWQPGQWDASRQQVSNWHAARAFRVANLAGRTGSPEALRGPFSQIATNVVQPDTGLLRTFVGTGDSQNLLDAGTRCRLGNPRACAEQGCGSQSYLEVQRAGSMASASMTSYSGYALANANSYGGSSGPSCAGASVKLTWDNTAANGCANGNDGAIEYTCDGSPSLWSCRETQNSWAVFNYTSSVNPSPQRFYGLWTYGGNSYRRFNTDTEAWNFDYQMFTDADLMNVGQFDSTGRVMEPQQFASPAGKGWYIAYASSNERSGSAATVIDGCLLWNSFEPAQTNSGACSAVGRNLSRLYQADPVSGRASCALGFYEPMSGAWSRYRPSGTNVPLGDPAPQRVVYDAEVHTRALLNTPPGSSAMGTSFSSVPVTQGPP